MPAAIIGAIIALVFLLAAYTGFLQSVSNWVNNFFAVFAVPDWLAPLLAAALAVAVLGFIVKLL